MPEHDTQMPHAPEWGAAFPPEQPLRGEAPSRAPATAWAPPAGAAPPGTILPPQFDPRHEDRRPIDGKRVVAFIVDCLVVAPVLLLLAGLFDGLTTGAALVYMAVGYSYFFFCEASFGRTVGKSVTGLRVERAEGGPATPSAIGLRTFMRTIDGLAGNLVGLIAMVATGRRRQRLGDLAAGTVVRVADRPIGPPPRSVLTVLLPVVAIGGALLAGPKLDELEHGIGLSSNPYVQRIDAICEKRVATEGGAQDFAALRRNSEWETATIAGLPSPPDKEARNVRKEVLRWKRRIDGRASRIAEKVSSSSDPQATFERELPALQKLGSRANARMSELGLPHCPQ